MKKTQQDKAYDMLLSNIMNGVYKPGMPLREDKIGEEFGFSSTPVREAFRRLEMEGWVESFPYRGSFLKKFTREEINDIYLLREVMEAVAVREAIKNASEEDMQKIEEALEGERKFISGLPDGQPEMHPPSVSPDAEFHKALVAASHSRIMRDKLATWNLQLKAIAISSPIKQTKEEIEDIYNQHCAIYDAMKRGWTRVAEEMIREHILRAREKNLTNYNENKNE